MAIVASEQGKPFPIPAAGSYLGRCVSVVDLGTHTSDFQGKPKTNRKVRLSFELPEEKAVFFEERGEEPFMVSKEYTLSLSDKASLRKDLENWRGRQFNAEELKGFDVSKLLGVPALITIIHKEGTGPNNGKTYANISGVSKPPKGMTCLDQINKSTEWSVDQGKNAVFERFPDWLKEKISKCHEWGNPPATESEGAHEAPAEDSSDMPF